MEEKELNRSFYIGSEWLYYKIYIGNNTANTFLRAFNRLITPLLDEKIVENFFFIRYADPDSHLRIRFKVRKMEHLSVIIKMMYELTTPFFNNHSIYKIQTDTYNREIERYGKNTMEDSEKLFYIDSKIILAQLSDNEDINDIDIWFKSLKIIDMYLDVFDFSLEQKALFIKKLADGFSKEFPTNRLGKKQLALKYRTNRLKIEQVLREKLDDILIQNRDILRLVAQKIMEKTNFERGIIESLLSSYLHMHCNRFFSNKQRMNEWLLYDFLSIYYKSEISKLKTKTVTNE